MSSKVKRDSEEEEGPVDPALSNVNQLMSIAAPFSSAQYVRDILSAVKLGEVNPLQAMVIVKRFEKVAKKVLEDKEFKNLGINEAEKYMPGNTKSFEYGSATICRGATYTTYDFSQCGHTVLNELYKIQEETEKWIKYYEEELKAIANQPPAPKVEGEEEFGISEPQKEIVLDRMPMLQWLENQDQIIVKAPKKMQTMGIKFMKV